MSYCGWSNALACPLVAWCDQCSKERQQVKHVPVMPLRFALLPGWCFSWKQERIETFYEARVYVIKSKKVRAEIQRQRKQEDAAKAELIRLEKESPHGIGAESSSDGTTIEHWDKTKEQTQWHQR